MELNELTPELFEKAEFTERRRGYDIDQVERFLEETGTAVAQLLVRHRQLEERLAQADARVAEAEQQLEAAAAATGPAEASRSAVSEAEEAAEIERATSTLLMAKRTADATIGEAEAEAARIRGEAATRSDQMVAEARQRAEDEHRATRDRILEEVATLEARRDGLGSIVEGFELRIGAYRDELGKVAGVLLAMTEDPEAFGARPDIDRGTAPTPATAPAAAPLGGEPAGRAVGEVTPGAAEDVDEATQAHDTASAAEDPGPVATAPAPEAGSGPWGQGSWSEVVETSDADTVDPSVSDDPQASGSGSDPYLQQLDEAVNEIEGTEVEGNEDAMTAFFEGGGEQEGRSRFGWRR